jgi:hypothetical protein
MGSCSTEMRAGMYSSTQQPLLESLRKSLEGLHETTGRLHLLTLEMSHDEAWGKVRDEVSCFDSIGDVTGGRQLPTSPADRRQSGSGAWNL